MKHIKLYEEYSDDELNDLLGDLKSVGHVPFKPKLGEDYGFTSKLLPEPPDQKGAFGVYFSMRTLEYMIRKGMAEGPPDVLTSPDTYRVQLKPQKAWDTSYGSYGPGNYKMEHWLSGVNFSGPIGKLYQLVGVSGDYGFGTSWAKPVGKKARMHSQKQFIEKFQKFVDQKGFENI